MRSMRDMMTIVEARKPAAPAVDTQALLGELTALRKTLAREDFRFSQIVVQKILGAVNAKKDEVAKHAADDKARYGDDHNPADFAFNADESLSEYTSTIIKSLLSHARVKIRKDIEQDEIDYQEMMSNDLENPSDHIEDSDYLRSHHEQERLAQNLFHFDVLNPSTYVQIIDPIKNFFAVRAEFDRHAQKVAPEWNREVVWLLEELLPVMIFVLKKGIV